jgi:hypothetical protein
MKRTKEEIQRAEEGLKELLNVGTEVYTALKHVSKSGMSRSISVHVVSEGQIQNITYWASCIVGWPIDRNNGGVKVTGCGMDMGFHLVYCLSSALWKEGFDCIGDKCPSNDHTNGAPRDGKSHHKSGGYALRQRWL